MSTYIHMYVRIGMHTFSSVCTYVQHSKGVHALAVEK